MTAIRKLSAAWAMLAALALAGPAGGDALRIRLWRLGALWASGLAVGAALAPPGHEVAWSATLAEARELVAERGERLLAPRPLLSGAEAAALAGVAPGPGLGAALAALVEAQVLGRVESVEAARAFCARAHEQDPGDAGLELLAATFTNTDRIEYQDKS